MDLKQKDKRTLIMDSALELFKKKGYTNTRIIDIADNAGIGKGTVYAYFASKEELLIELIGTFARDEYDVFVSKSEDAHDMKAGISLYVEFIEEMVEKYGMFALSFHHNVTVGDERQNLEEFIKIADEIYIRLFDIVKRILEKGAETENMGEEDIEMKTLLVMDTVVSYVAAMFSNRTENAFCVHRPGFSKYKSMTREKLVEYITYGICGKESGHEQ